MFVSGTNDKGMFDIGIDFLNSNRWKFSSGMGNVRSILDEFFWLCLYVHNNFHKKAI